MAAGSLACRVHPQGGSLVKHTDEVGEIPSMSREAAAYAAKEVAACAFIRAWLADDVDKTPGKNWQMGQSTFWV
jgi:hypothetical protein